MRKAAEFPGSSRSFSLRQAVVAVVPVVVLVTTAAAAAVPLAQAESSTTVSSSTSTTATTLPACPALATTASIPPATLPPVAAGIPSTMAMPSWGTARASTTSTRAQMVRAVVSVGDIAYLGGEFTKMVPPSGGTATSRTYLAAVDATTGKLTSWNPHADGKVWSMELAVDQQSLYVGGDFHHIGGKSAYKLARIDLATGKLDTKFRPSVNGRVRTIAMAGDRLYVGGEFTSVSQHARPKLAAIDPITGAVLPWMPPALGPGRYLTHTGIPTPDYAPGHVFAVKVIGDKVFAAGTFIDFGCQEGLVALDAATGGLSSPQYELGRPIFDLDTSGGMLYAVGGGPGGRAWALQPDTKKPVWTAKFDGDAVGVATSGRTVYVAGHYDYIVSKDSSCWQYCPEGTTRHHLAAFAAADGKLTGWNPAADTSTGPETVTAGANALFVGGEFNKINKKAQPGFAVFPGAP